MSKNVEENGSSFSRKFRILHAKLKRALENFPASTECPSVSLTVLRCLKNLLKLSKWPTDLSIGNEVIRMVQVTVVTLLQRKEKDN
jgi:hypothetical protein